MFGVIDRFEGKMAVIEMYSGEVINIERTQLPAEAKEGDVLKIGETITVDEEETKKRRKKVDELTKDIWA
ncbi:DUF3006 domain-containing protein [Clostridium omnivorum]|uniref:Pyruvate kinase n=1 Tax=Clostridium omnivorum TaxID=1604902 RepID=A0ABQ5N555_9CLOT|nr:DUF3006 domain-containing protein [Clostridium sp. E14]GLC30359.1 hypothetical protein bsdE14_17690 [Clostridium sp. E14]